MDWFALGAAVLQALDLVVAVLGQRREGRGGRIDCEVELRGVSARAEIAEVSDTTAMARPGPRPKPTALRVLRGDPPSRINRHEPGPRKGEPKMPSWLPAPARVHWRRTLRVTPLGVVTPADETALGLYCIALSEYLEAAALVASKGMLVPGRDGNLVTNPAVRIERDRWMLVHRMGCELGLTPSSRSSLSSSSSLSERDLDVAARLLS